MKLSVRVPPLLTACALCCLSLVASAFCATPIAPPTKSDPILGERIAKGVAFDGRLWLEGTMISRDDPTGGLVSFGMTDAFRQKHFARGVLDVQNFGNELWVLRSVALKSRALVISVWRKGAFEDLAQFDLPIGDDPIVLLNGEGIPRVLSRRAVRTFSGNNRNVVVVDFKGELRRGVQTSVATLPSSDVAFIGFNLGEWGGGLQRVDLRTGIVTNIERRDSKQLCSGPLNSDCDPVTGVIPDPQNEDCVLVSVGLVHLFTSEGRLLRVCGEIVTLLSEKPVTSKADGGRKQTEAFYGLVPAPGGMFWALTWRALYRFNGGETKEYELPKLREVSGVHLSYDLPGVVIVRTDVNWAVSTSGYTPLVIPLPGPKP